MSTRTGFLSDENMKKICATHRPVPINRPDLLPARPVNTSGIYMRKLKEMPVLQRPAKANYMLNSIEEMTGTNVSAAYVDQLEKRIDRKPLRMLPRAFGGVDQQTYTNLSSVPDVADEMYRQGLIEVGLTAFVGEQFGELESLPASEVPATIATLPSETQTVLTEAEEVAEIGTQTVPIQEDYLIPFLKKNREEREKIIRNLLRGYRKRGLEPPVPNFPNQPSLAQTEQIFREFLDDIYEYSLDFDLEELLQIPTEKALGEPSGAVAGPSTLSGAETGLA